jgi:hypothetical protein
MSNNSLFWRFVYRAYPPFLRLLERIHIHYHRQDFLIGKIIDKDKIPELVNYLKEKNFEPAILAWKDPGEVIGLRKIDNKKYQYHLRIFEDLELRGHYEFSSESNPWGHVTSKVFEERKEYFQELLRDYLRR